MSAHGGAGGLLRPSAQGPAGGGAGMPALQRWVIGFLILFLLIFPKGGVRIGDIPVTWGYLALAPVMLAFPLALATGTAGRLARQRLLVLAALAPFQLLSWGSFLAYGVESTGYTVAFVIALFFLPLAFVLAFAPWIDRLDLPWLLRLVRWGIFAVAVYGIFLFFFKLATGRFVEIPLLTVNSGDVGMLEHKHINRGGIFKLISTYNNGNLYGVALLLLLPLYCWTERSFARTSVVKMSLVLTLSRTVWIGLLLHEIVNRLYVRRVTARAVVVLALSLSVLMVVVWYAIVYVLGFDAQAFIFDANLGGRAYSLRVLQEFTLLPGTRYFVVEEMVYVSILRQFGILGLVSFLVAMSTPLALHLLRATPWARSEFKRSIAAGLMVYLVVSISDGGLVLIPIMAFFWFQVSLLLSDNPTWPGAAARLERERVPLPLAAASPPAAEPAGAAR